MGNRVRVIQFTNLRGKSVTHKEGMIKCRSLTRGKVREITNDSN